MFDKYERCHTTRSYEEMTGLLLWVMLNMYILRDESL